MGNQVNNTLTYLDLLELVKIGKQPKRIKYRGSEFNWDGNEETYMDNSSSGITKFLDYRIGEERSMKGCCDRSDIEVLPNRLRILDTVERNYLLKALVPLKVKAVKNVKISDQLSLIRFQLHNGTIFDLPSFKTGTMYTGMEPDRWYDLEYLLSQPARPVNRK